MKRILIALLLVFLSSTVFAFDGLVTKVKDGDTAVIGGHTCRLYGIDAPEIKHGKKSGQPYGEESMANLGRLILGKVVSVETGKQKTYGRDVCRITYNGTDINLQMVRDGMAWAYVQYLKRPHASEYIDAEREARNANRGLWHQSNPQPPWEFRHKK